MKLKSFAKELEAVYTTKDDVHRMKIGSSDALSEFARKIFPVQIDYREAFMCVYLNTANNTIGFTVIGLGGLTGTIADPKTVFQHALLCNARGVILVHNHPSGNLTPSQSDINLTKKMVDCGKLLDITVLDHVILTEESFYSFADNGLIN
jgi:DNA repair protein RadC